MAAESASTESRRPQRMQQNIFRNIIQMATEMEYPQPSKLKSDAYNALMKYIENSTPANYDILLTFIRRRPPKSIVNEPAEKSGMFPLQFAITIGNTLATDFLIRNGADVNQNYYMKERTINDRNIRNASGMFKRTTAYTIPLILAVTLPRLDYRVNLPRKAFPKNISDEEREKLNKEYTERNKEYKENNGPLQLLLYAKDIDVNKQDHLGRTALHYAAAYTNGGAGFPNRIKLLLEHGARLRIQDNDGKYPLNYAHEAGNQEALRVFSEKIKEMHEKQKERRQAASASESASASANGNHGGKRKTHRRKHHRRRTHRK
jgi:ankyrin repeat protein